MNLITRFKSPFQVELCFDPIIRDLQKLSQDTANERAYRAKILLEEISLHPQLMKGMNDLSPADEVQSLIRRLLSDYFPAALTLNEIKAVNIPYTNVFFNLTQRFKNILAAAGPNFEMAIRDLDEHQFYVLTCCIILNQYYSTNFDFAKPIFYDIPTQQGTLNYYRILYNADFLKVIPGANAIQLSAEDIDRLMDNYNDLALWKEKFPENSWILRGFAIMTLYNASTENAVSTLKEKLLGLNVVDFQESIGAVFQSIFQIPDLQIGFTVFNTKEDKFEKEVFGQQIHSFILQDKEQLNAKEILGEYVYKQLVVEKNYFAVSDTKVFAQKSNLVSSFFSQHIKSFILAPVVKNGILLGLLEVVSSRAKELHSINAHKLEMVMPFITDTIERQLSQLENQLHSLIQENYTSVHSSVYWKFRDEAKRLMHHLQTQTKYALNEIVFSDVYPLYGQLDIMDSSEARNAGVQKDLQAQLRSLIPILDDANNLDPSAILLAGQKQLRQFYAALQISIEANTEQELNNYLSGSIHPHLKKITSPVLIKKVAAYFEEMEKHKGIFHTHRRMYENTIAMINDQMIEMIDARQKQAQAHFPHYFERFKTDGIEHNLYIGSSISHGFSFSLQNLYELRL